MRNILWVQIKKIILKTVGIWKICFDKTSIIKIF